MSESHAVAYKALRSRVRDVVEGAGASALAGVVPATPSWRGHDVLAHMVGVTNDVVHGRLDGVASDRWTAAQVDARAALATADLLAEWDEFGPQFESLLAAAPAEIAGQAIFDAATHEHDLRNALRVPGARDTDAVELGWDWILGARTRNGEPQLCFAVEDGEQTSGVGNVVARIAAPRFELFRAVSGRRTAEEIARYDWNRAPDPALVLAADIFSFPGASLRE